MIFNGIHCTTIEQLEELIIDLSEDQKQAIRNDFNGIINEPGTTIPRVVSPRQIRVALIMSGISLETISLAMESLSEPTKSIAKVTWEYSVEFQRDNPFISMMSPVLGLSNEQIDNLFILASTL